MLNKIIEILKYSKLPTILLILVLFYFSHSFIKGESDFYSPSVVIGGIIGVIAILFVIFSYADYRAREKIDHIISKYETALNNISTTHSRYEREKRSTLEKRKDTIGSDRKGGGYSIEDSNYEETSDNI